MQFFFREGDIQPGAEPTGLVFVKQDRIIQLDFNEE